MRRMNLLVLALFCLAEEPAFAAWRLGDGGRLKSPWAENVDPAKSIPHAAYPRPQLVRSEWLNLNGLWQCAMATSFDQPPIGKNLAGEILVPFPVESALSGVMDEDFSSTHKYLWYRRLFSVPATWQGRRIRLHFEAVDYEAVVYVNGMRIGSHRGGYDAFSFDITDQLRPGDNELIVGAFDETNTSNVQARGKQTMRPNRYHYTGSSGIWQTVWLEPVREIHVTSLTLVPDIGNETLRLRVIGTGTEGLQVEATALDQGEEVGSVDGAVGEDLALTVPNPKLWSPDHPFLYDLTVTLKRGDQVVDEVRSYFGMRSIEMKKIGRFMRPLLNGSFLFQTGTLDQGFWPDGLYTAPTDEALRFDIEMHKAMGFNMIRKHVKVEPKRWFYWADKLGILVWQDMPHITAGSRGDDFSQAVKSQFEIELKEMIREHSNSPSVILWVVFNEGWGAYEYDRMTDLARRADPHRIINTESGITASKARDPVVGDVLDNHIYGEVADYRRKYRQIIEETPNPDRIYAVTEYGGGNMEYRVDGHMWFGDPEKDTKTSSCPDRNCRDCVTDKFIAYNDTFLPLIVDEGLSALAVTQYTDLEIERNGLMTYDRRVEKCHVDRVRAKNREMIAVTLGDDPIVAPGAAVVRVSDQFSFTEGPARDHDGNIFFTDQPKNKIWKWSENDGRLSVFHDAPGRANGLYFDRSGNLLACADQDNELWSIDAEGKATVLVTDYQGRKLNGPNDLWPDRNGGIYFTDPFYKRPYWNRGPMEQDGQHVYYLSPDQTTVSRVIDDLQQPNGIIGTPDGMRLYVADIRAGKTYAYDVTGNGVLANKTLFAPMGSDGMTIDDRGNVYLTGRAGVTVFSPTGDKIETIPVDSGWTANVSFGGREGDTLFITAKESVYTLKMMVRGTP